MKASIQSILKPLLAIVGSLICVTTVFAEQKLDSIVAIVNNGVIVESELNEAISKIKMQLQATNTAAPPADILRKQVLEQLINRRLQLQLADMAGINITDEQLDKAIFSIAKKNRISVDQLYLELAKQGINKNKYRDDIHDEFVIHSLQEKAVAPTVNISQQEVNDFIRSAAWQAHNNKEYHLKDILIALPDAPSTEDITAAKKRADMLAGKLRNGTNFSQAAFAESDNNKALQGGDLGWRKLPEIPTAFSSIILLAKEGDIVGPIQTSNGFHILAIEGIRDSGIAELTTEEQHKQVQQLLFERKFEEALQSWITKIRGEAFIDNHPQG